jgi:hypothetical protein
MDKLHLFFEIVMENNAILNVQEGPEAKLCVVYILNLPGIPGTTGECKLTESNREKWRQNEASRGLW